MGFAKRLWFSTSDTIRVIDRDTHIRLDMFVDFFFLIFPLAMIKLYNMTLAPEFTLQIVILPSISLFSKFRAMLFEIFQYNIDELILLEQEQESFKLKRNRKSIYGTDRK